MKITRFWLPLITTACLCTPVLAQPPGGDVRGFAPPSFADIDKDKDGKVVKEELSGFFASRLPPGGGPGGGGPGGGGGAGGGPGAGGGQRPPQ